LGGVTTANEAIEAVRQLVQQNSDLEESTSLASAQAVSSFANNRIGPD
jgi:hypothetical protein